MIWPVCLFCFCVVLRFTLSKKKKKNRFHLDTNGTNGRNGIFSFRRRFLFGVAVFCCVFFAVFRDIGQLLHPADRFLLTGGD